MTVEKIFDSKGKTREEWLQARKQGIGGSESATLLGLNPWSSTLDLYLNKTTDEVNDFDSERMRIGRDLEEYVAQRFSEAAGKKVRRNNYMMRNTKFPHLVANIDREIVGENAGLECKTTNSYSGRSWLDDEGNLSIPYNYLIQIHHYMTVCEFDYYYIAILIGNEAFVWEKVERDGEISQMIIDAVNGFYENYIDKEEMPPPDGSNNYTEILNKKWSGDNEEEVDLSSSLEEVVKRYWDVLDMEKDLKDERQLLEQQIKMGMQDNTSARLKNYSFTWKNQASKRIDTKILREKYPDIAKECTVETQNRVFRKKREDISNDR